MVIRTYRTQPFETTHENRIFDALLKELKQNWADSEELLILLGNFYCNGSEIDAAILKRKSITVIDFKDYGGNIHFSENGKWFADNVEIKGGNKENPYLQIRHNKFALLDFLKGRLNLPSGRQPNFGHISGLALFHKPIIFDELQLPGTISPWFHIVDIDHVTERMAQITSREIDLTHHDLETIVSFFSIPEYIPIGRGYKAVTPQFKDDNIPEIELPEYLQSPLSQINKFLESSEKILILSGMIGTGLEAFFKVIAHQALRQGRNYSLLAPNRRIASQYPVSEAESIYTCIYSGNPKIKQDKIIYELIENRNNDRHLYIIGDSHLISDANFEANLRRYGSGQLLTDLCNFLDLNNSNRQIIFIGDPFQITRGKIDESALCSERVTAITGCPVKTVYLEYIVSENQNSLLIKNALELASSIRDKNFNYLHIMTDNLQCLASPKEKEEKYKLVTSLFDQESNSTKFLAYSHVKVNEINNWIRQKFFQRDHNIACGDIVNIHNSFFVKNDDIPDSSIYVPNDSFAEVIKIKEDIQPLIQPLKGRDEPIKVNFIHLRVRLLHNNQEIEFLCLKDYLYAEKPEIDKDTLLALYISAKTRFKQLQNLETTNIEESDYEESVALANFLRGDPYLNAAQLRFGYALTVNRAQGQKFRTVIANMDTNQGKTNETYFRWVYTLFSIANDKLILSNIPSITPFDRAIWDASNSKIDSIYPCNFIEFDPNAEIGIENIIEFDIPEVALRNFYWYIKKKLDAQGIKITSYNHHNYQEIYSFEAENVTAYCSIRFYYNGKYQISRAETIKSDPPDFAEKVRNFISSEIVCATKIQQDIYKLIQNKLDKYKILIQAIEHNNYEEIYYLTSKNSNLKLKITYDGDGFITRLSPLKYSNNEIMEAVRIALEI
ncbi:nuclease-related domain-containing protein [Nostoc sp. FACHB-190]|uniref:nuclease-related domain-containing protein n=1 Tax=Nostoc sp. FACHB-190 TaxID=2692838 RepID=UPI001688D3FA|nr:nuclease-related domain-containing protein [Nostoc sp. FACHB-190]MBD2298387.1 NERD domain-containing protein [Nostoc sp. FACHB-190]